MKKNKIIYVEGVPASGKTTIVKKLYEKFDNTIDIIPEYINLADGSKAEISHDPNYFRNNDEMKWQIASQSKKSYTFVDRGHLSTVIYNLAEFKIAKKIENLEIIDWYFEKILANNCIPDYYILLQTNPINSLKRRQRLLGPHNMWEHEKALHFANEYYVKLIRSYEPKSKILILNTDIFNLNQIEEKIIEYFNLHNE